MERLSINGREIYNKLQAFVSINNINSDKNSKGFLVSKKGNDAAAFLK